MRSILSAIILAIGIAAPPAKAEFQGPLVARGVLTVATSGSAPPFSMTNASGALEGFDIDVMNTVGKELGLPVKFVQLDFAGLLPGLAAGRFDVIASGVARTPERLASKDFFLLSPYIVNGAAITRRANDQRIKSWKDVCGLTMGAVRGGVFQKIATEKLPAGCVTSTREYPGSTELFLDLANGRIDFAAHDFLGPNYLVATKKVDNLTVIPEVLAPSTQSVAVGPKEEALAKEIDQLLGRWRQDGTLKTLAQKWFGTSLDWSMIQ